MAQEITMLHDVARCSACRACMVACKQWHDLPADMSTPFEGQYQSHKDLTSTTWNLIQMHERVDGAGKFHWDFFKKQCMHCGDPACMNGCPEEAIEKKAGGAVVINPDKCVGCGYCTANCPFGIPKVDAESHKSTKCDLCFDRIAEGMEPACSKTCTADAIRFGSQADMLARAQERVDILRAEGHPDANVYNPQGVGGVHMVYVLPEKPAVYGLPENPQTPASINIWKDVVRPVGKIAGVGAIAGVLGLTALTAMRGKGDK